MWLNKFLKKEKLNFFTLEEIENYKNGILLLESNFFHLIPLTLSKDIDEREREFEITEKLENIFDEYDSFYFLDKEIILEEDEEKEKTLLILIEKDKIYTLLDNLKDKKTDLLGIYPLFLIELFNKDNLEKISEELEIEYQNKIDSISKKYADEFNEYKLSLEKKVLNKKDFSELLEKLLLN